MMEPRPLERRPGKRDLNGKVYSPDAAGQHDAAAEDEQAGSERSRHLRRQQLSLLARQFARSPYANVIAIAFVAYTAWGHVTPWLIGAWGIALIGVVTARGVYAWRVLRKAPADVDRALFILTWSTFANGLVTGAAAPLFLPSLLFQEQALLTMILVCVAAGGVSTAAAYPRAFYAYVVPTLGPLAAIWALPGAPQNIGIAILLVPFALILVFFVRENQRVIRDSFRIRYENERLLDALAKEREAVLLARDRAEEANRAKSRFLAAASHDLRQPLHALSLYGAALSVRASDAGTREIAGHIDKAIASLSVLLDSLLDISKLDAGAVRPEFKQIDISTMLDRIEANFRPIAQEKGLEFTVARAAVEVETDGVLLERIVRNLVDNAFKYTKSGSVAIRTEISNHAVCVTVRDTGPGIPLDEREHIFEEFYQIENPERDREQGLGLGLAIVRRLAGLLGATLHVESEPGHGSAFSVTLPRATGHAATVTATVQDKAVDAGIPKGLLVLVIDDEAAVRMGMRALLESWGCRVRACRAYDEAARIVDEGGPPVGLVIADFRLREHESGIEAVRHLRERLGNVPALLVTGDTASERVREAQASGLPVLYKPVPAERLMQTMVSLLRR